VGTEGPPPQLSVGELSLTHNPESAGVNLSGRPSPVLKPLEVQAGVGTTFQALSVLPGAWTDTPRLCTPLWSLLAWSNRVVYATACQRRSQLHSTEAFPGQYPTLGAVARRAGGYCPVGGGSYRLPQLSVSESVELLLEHSEELRQLYNLQFSGYPTGAAGVAPRVTTTLLLPVKGKVKSPALKGLTEGHLTDTHRLQTAPQLLCVTPEYTEEQTARGVSVSYANKLSLAGHTVLGSNSSLVLQVVGAVLESDGDYTCFLRTSTSSSAPVNKQPGLVLRGSSVASAQLPAGRVLAVVYTTPTAFDQSPPPVVLLPLEKPKALEEPKALEVPGPAREALVDRPRVHRSHAGERDRFSHAVRDSPYSTVEVTALVRQGLEVPGTALPPSSCVLKEYAFFLCDGLAATKSGTPGQRVC
jgi:hypothetical protein